MLPQLENALLAGHDVIFLGERGQAKTRMIRSLIEPARRVDADRRRAARSTTTRTTRCRSTPAMLVAERGDDDADRVGAPRPPLRREARHPRHVDRRPHRRGRPDQGRRGPLPLRRAHASTTASCRAPTAASSRSTSCPTSPSASRSACSTCSRSATSRSAATRSGCRSTSCSFASANPEDYTNRGRIITPLKDRFGAQIRTHYPLDVEHRGRRSSSRRRGRSIADGLDVAVPDVHDRDRRRDQPAGPPIPHINQRSGVSVRLVDRRTTRRWSPTRPGARCATARREVVPRVSDLDALVVVDRRQGRDRDRSTTAARSRCSSAS